MALPPDHIRKRNVIALQMMDGRIKVIHLALPNDLTMAELLGRVLYRNPIESPPSAERLITKLWEEVPTLVSLAEMLLEAMLHWMVRC